MKFSSYDHSPNIVRFGIWILLLGALLGFALTFGYGDRFIYPLWADRDLYRASLLVSDFHFTGSELMTGGRTPGGFYYYFLWLILLVTEDPIKIHSAIFLLNGLAMVLLFSLTKSYLGILAAAFSTAFFIASRALFTVQIELQNPAFTPFLAVIIYYLLVLVIVDSQTRLLPWFVLAVLLTAQVHLSYLSLFAILIVALALFRVRPKAKDVGWSFVAVAVALGPYFVREAILGFSNFASATSIYATSVLPISEIFGRYMEHVVHTLFNFHTYDIGALVKDPLRFIVVTTATGFFPVLFISFTLIFFYSFVGGAANPVKSDDGIQTRLILLMYLVLVVGTIITLMTGIQSTPRRLIFMMPAALIIGGAAFSILFTKISALKHSRARTVLGIGTLTLCLATITWNSVVQFIRWKDQFPTYQQINSLIRTLNKEFGFGQLQLEKGVVYVRKNSTDRWEPETTHERAAYTFLIRNVRALTEARSISECAAVFIHKNGYPETPLSRDEITRAFTGYQIKSIGRIKRASNFTLVEYQAGADNCYRTFNNRYLMNEDEKWSVENAVQQRNSGRSEEGKFNGLMRIGFQFDSKPSLFGAVTMRRDGKRLQAVLNSRQLRGIDMIAEYNVDNPRLKFTNAQGDIVEVSFFSGKFGGKNIAFPPWRSDWVEMPAGTYKIDFVVDRLKTPFEVTEKRIATLAKSFSLN